MTDKICMNRPANEQEHVFEKRQIVKHVVDLKTN